jgi:hypothetical protein
MPTTRISAQSIDNIVKDPTRVVSLGAGSFGLSMFFSDMLIQKTRKSTIDFKYAQLSQKTSREQFLEVVELHLERNHLYLAEVVLQQEKWGGIIPYKIQGKIYREAD